MAKSTRQTRFRKAVKNRVRDILGHNISSDKAGKILKACFATLVEEVALNPDDKGRYGFTIPGLGRFSITKRKVRDVVGEKHPLEGKVDFIPSLKWTQSKKIKAYLFRVVLNLDRRNENGRE